ncbi:LysR family transcriptional regulator [uncultured Cyclobacterium sp.]|uniref:LysR family transcriptional regulator n=1 Tax=uncultured Cyclobacterium sp. TaxID=453820 RepID=UPI0030EC48EB|tara:strand:+ start:78305 stop:79210 length:906 start_codon:yes stop_codon:yes gene_type:complete
MINLEWYRTFVAIFENKTLTKAAEKLYSSQPGMSVHLNALESYIGKKLFIRTSRSMIPTEEGKHLYSFIIESIQKLEKAEQHFKKTSRKRKAVISIGMCTETFQAILEPEVPTLKFNLVAKFGDHKDLIKDLNNGVLDLVITPKPSNEASLVEYEAFTKETLLLVTGSQSSLARISPWITEGNYAELEKSLKKEIWYSASNEMEHFRRFWFDNFKNKPDFNPNYILPNISSIIRCLENSEGFAIVPDFLVKEAQSAGKIIIAWEGEKVVSNILYFATRTALQNKSELDTIKEIFKRKMISY